MNPSIKPRSVIAGVGPEPSDVLRYESRDMSALEPGEELLWEGGGKALRAPEFRITNRRAFYSGKGKKTPYRQSVRWPFRRQIAVELNNGGATIKLGFALWITGVQDWAVAVAHLIRLNQVRTRKRRRRSSPRLAMESVMQAVQVAKPPIDYSSDATDLGLIENEQVIWTGRPIIKPFLEWYEFKRHLRTVGWLVVPTVLAGFAYYRDDQVPGVRLGCAAVASIWTFFALYSILISPITDRWRLRRTRYMLTNRRAVAVSPENGKQTIRFFFIDALPAAFERQMFSDGSGDLLIGYGMVFRQIPEAMAVHQLVVNAVLVARRDLPDLGWQESPSAIDGF